MKIACRAWEGMYQGLHGIECLKILETSNNIIEANKDLEDWGRENSSDLIYSFGLEDEYLEDADNDDITEIIYYCERGWQGYKIKDEYKNLPNLDELLCEYGFELFIEKYCENKSIDELAYIEEKRRDCL